MTNWHRMFALDTRSLSVFRIGLAVAVIVSVAQKMMHWKMFYSDVGLFTRALQTQTHGGWSLHALSGSAEWSFAVNSLIIVSALSLMLGRYTKASLAVIWILLVSLANRNQYMTYSGDTLLQLMIFWGFFLPLNRHFVLGQKNLAPVVVSNIASFALLAQVAFLYFFAALLKTSPEWGNGTAVFHSLSLGRYATPYADLLLQFPALLEIMTHKVWWFELLGAALFFSPYRTEVFRLLGVLLFMSMHLGFSIFLSIGFFPYFDVVLLVALLPSLFWALASRNRVSVAVLHESGRVWLPMRRLVVGGAMLLALTYNIATVVGEMPNLLHAVAYKTRIAQRWAMFNNISHTEWFVLRGTKANGEEIDVFPWLNGKALQAGVTFEKPRYIHGTYQNDLALAYWERVADERDAWDIEPRIKRLYNYVCESLEHSNIESVELVLVRQRIGANKERSIHSYGQGSCRAEVYGRRSVKAE